MLPEQVVVERPHQGADPTSHLSVFSTPAGVPLSLMADTALARNQSWQILDAQQRTYRLFDYRLTTVRIHIVLSS